MYSQKMYFCARTLVQLKPFLTLIFFFMKTKLLLLLAMCIGMTSSAWALEKDGDVYQISSAQDLRDFAVTVNEGEYSASAVLTTNIDFDNVEWTSPIGSEAHPYTGTFDGKGFTISKFIYNTTANNTGFFGNLGNGAVVKNFTIEGTINSAHQRVGVIGSVGSGSSAKTDVATISNIHSKINLTCTQTRHGGVLGSQNGLGTVNIDHCTYSGTLDAGNTTGNFGGIVGLTNNNSGSIVNITNCLFDGTVSNGTGTNAGGIVGYTNKTKVTITNCLSVGSVESANPGQFFGQLNASNSKWSGVNYYVTADPIIGTVQNDAKVSGSAPTQATSTQLTSGELCYLLNGSQSKNVKWFQKLPGDAYPTLIGSDVVYLTGHLHCNGVAYEGETAYSNINASEKDEHIYVNGLCSYCSFPDVNYLTPNTDGYYEIGTANQLKWFAAFVNCGGENMSANAVLVADIDMKGESWPEAIGNWVNNIGYKGHFDGQGHAIKNLTYTTTKSYHGFFGVILGGAIVENFSIYGDVTNVEYDAIAPIAYSKEAPVYIRNIHSYLNITSSGNDKKVGGILGNGNQGTTYVDRCIFSGTLSSTNKTNCGGIVAYFQNNANSFVNISNCLFEGKITSTANNAYCGGIVGYIGANNSVYTITNCLSVGTFDAPVAGSIFGYVRNAGGGFSNNYYCGGATSGLTEGTGANNDATSVTTEQLASGEVAAKLGIAFRQNLEDEGESKKDPCPVIPMTDDDLLEHDVVVEITEAGYATLYIPDVDVVADEIKAFTGELNGEKLELIPVKDKTSGVCFIPAQTAVILKGAPGIYSLIPGFGAAKIEGNVLKGSAEDVEATGKYVLAKPEDGEVGFYLASGGTIKAGKAYLELPATEVKAFYFGGEDATGINGLNDVNDLNDAAIYNVAGQRVSKLQKGINIVNGKKVLK